MNKISMSQTCLYNFSYKKAARFLQQPVDISILFMTYTRNLKTVI